MTQLEIQYFWPLTEQLPLDLEYTACEPPKLHVTYPFDDTTILWDLNGINAF